MAEPITTDDLTTGEINGTGVFDELMASVKSHLELEYNSQRIRGPEYSQVYLGGLQAVLQQSIGFLLAKEKAEKDTALVEAQTVLLGTQNENALKEGLILDQTLIKTEHEIDNLVLQGKVLIAQDCKLKAEFNLIQGQTLKVASEKSLLDQKAVTESAQTNGIAIDDSSVIGKQNALYVAQTNGFQRDAEQKATKILVDTWSVRRTTDEATQANVDNKLDDAYVGQAVAKLMSGINA